MNTLIVYQLIPESTRVYLVPNEELRLDVRDALKTAQGTYMNNQELSGTQSDAHDIIGFACLPEEYADDERARAADEGIDESLVACLQRYLVKETDLPTEDANVSCVFICGFAL